MRRSRLPWWPSKIYSAEDHYAWLQDKHGIKGVPVIGQYLLNGGDMLATLVDTCQTNEKVDKLMQ